MGGSQFGLRRLNFLPFIKCKNKLTGKNIKILIDTGANKNIVKPNTIPKHLLSFEKSKIKNILGTQEVTKIGKINFFGHNLPKLPYYELNFHEYFDGILGSESMAFMNAKIDYKTNTIALNGNIFKFHKYYPNKFYNHIVTFKTKKNGDWIVSEHKELNQNIILEPGLYKSEHFETTVNILTNTPEIPERLPKLNLNVNNFETIQPIEIYGNNLINKELIAKMIRTEHLSEQEKRVLIKTIYENQKVLLKQNEKLSATTIIKHKINTKDEDPVYTKTYRYPHHFKKDVEDHIKELLDSGIVRNSSSPYSSPIWVVPKKPDASGIRKVRVVIDYRKLNEKTINDKFPIPQIEEILDNLGKSTYFSTLDLKSGFHQIPMDKNSQEKTAFSTDQGHFEFTRMPFGLKNGPATFQRAMNNVLHGLIGNICYVYLDDIIVVGFNLDNHIENLQEVLKRLSQFNLKIQLDKCEFLKRETEFLGHIITQDGVKPNPDKIKKILEWPIPTTQKQIKQFLGLSGYYRRFIHNYSKISKNLTKFLKKGTVVNILDPEYVKSFETLKNIIATDQILAYPDFNKPFILTTDASEYALGAVLSQMHDKLERPIAFASRTLNDTEIRYATNEKEALAIIWAVKKYQPYLYGNRFTLVTDHKPLTFIKTSEKNSKILRWRLELENFDYDVIYKEGKANVVADALSRLQIDEIKPNREEEINFHDLGIQASNSENASMQNNASNSDSDADTVHSANTSDDYYIHFAERPINFYNNQIIFRVSELDTIITEEVFPKVNRTIIIKNEFRKEDMIHYLKRFHNGKQSAILAPEILYGIIQETCRENFSQNGHFVLVTKIVEDVTSEDRQNSIIVKEHERAHRGMKEVESQIRRSYFFPNMIKKIKIFINACNICNMHKYDRKPYNIKISPRPNTKKPLERVHIDIFSINKTNFLSIIDSFSKHLQMVPIETKNLTDTTKALTKYFTIFGIPNSIFSDHETTFQSAQFKEYLSRLNIKLEYVSSSESNGQVEKTHSTIIEIFNTNKDKIPSSNTLTAIELSVALYNNSVHSSTGFTPNEIIFNQNNLINPNEIQEQANNIFKNVSSNLEKTTNRMKKQNERKEEPPKLVENQIVYLKPYIRSKAQPRGINIEVKDVTMNTFKNKRNIKRNKNRIKRVKKL